MGAKTPPLGGPLAAAAVIVAASCDSGAEPSAPASRASPSAEAEAPVRWSGPRLLRKGPAHKGPWRMNESRFRYVDDPAVAPAGESAAAVAWVDNERKNVFFQRYGPEGAALLERPTNVSRSPEIFSWLPRVRIAGKDGQRVYALWQEIVFSGGTHGGEAFFARSTDGGRSFSEPRNLSRTPAGDGKGRLTDELWHNGSLDLAVAADAVYAVWSSYEGRLWFRRSTDGGRSFEAKKRLSRPAGEPARGPSMAVGPSGTLHVAWAVGDSESAALRYARSTDRGRSFAAPERVPEARRAGHADAPALCATRSGGLHLAYAFSPAGMLESYHVRHAYRPAEAKHFRDDARVSESARARFPRLGVTREGAVLIVWERYPDPAPRPRGLGYAVRRGDGERFSAPAVIAGTADPDLGRNGSLQGLFMQKLAVRADGGVLLANSRFRPGAASRIRLYRARLDR